VPGVRQGHMAILGSTATSDMDAAGLFSGEIASAVMV
jgi:hypothetical protein